MTVRPVSALSVAGSVLPVAALVAAIAVPARAGQSGTDLTSPRIRPAVPARAGRSAPSEPDAGALSSAAPARAGRSLPPARSSRPPSAAPVRAGQSDFWFTDELAPYRELVGAYLEGDEATSAAGARAMAPAAVHALLDRVRAPDARPTGTDADPALNERLFRAAAMMHLDAAGLLRSRGLHRDAEEQLEIAMRWVNLSARDPEPVGSFRRRWFLGAALLAFEYGGWRDGVTFTDLACELLPDDVALLTAAAWFNEGLALAPVDPGDLERGGLARLQERKRSRLLAAARRAGAALRAAPAASEAALRLARVRMLLGQGESVRALLTELTERGGVPRAHAYLGRLLLGRLHVEAGEAAEAERRFREAIALVPEGQAARVALAHLFEGRGDRRGAAAVLDPVLRGEFGPAIDPWVDYLLGAGAGPGLRDALRGEVQR